MRRVIFISLALASLMTLAGVSQTHTGGGGKNGGGGAPTGPCGGDLGGTFPNCTVIKVDGVAYPASPSTNTIPVVTGANTVTYELVPLSSLATQAADTVDMNATGGSASPTAVAMPTCTSGADLYNTTTHSWSCVTTGSTLPTGTTGQGTYYAAGGTALTATSATTTTSASAGFPYGIGMAPITDMDVAGTQSQIAPNTGTVTLNGSCGATATSCTITGGASLNANGGYVLVGYQDGSNDQEYMCYSAATSTTLTIGGGNCGTPVTTAGRSYFATTAASHATGNQVVQVLWIDAASITATPRAVRFGNGGNGDSSWGSLNPNTLGHNTGFMIGDTLYIVGNGACLSSNPTNTNLGLCLTLANGSLEWSNTASNPALITAGATLDYAIATQGITGNGTLTAITNAKTPTMPNNNTAAAAGAGGVLSSHCTIIWNQATSGTVGFGVKASAAPTDLWVKEQDQIGTALAPIFTTITSTTTTATSGTVTPTAFGTTYASDIWLAMNPGTSNSVSVQLYAQASANTITIEPGTGCTAWQ